MTEKFLANNDYLVGDTLTLADISCVCNLNTLELIVPVDEQKHSKLKAWLQRMTTVTGYQEISEGAKLLPARIELCLQANREKAKTTGQ